MAVGAIATMVSKIAELLAIWHKSSDRRRMQAAIEAGEKYIQSNENTSLSSERKEKLLVHYKKRFFKYN